MKPFRLLVLCMTVLLPTCQSQEACVPPQIPDSTINCTAVDSVFLSCACNVYKSSILEIMGTLSCADPSIFSSLLGAMTPTPTPALVALPDGVLPTFGELKLAATATGMPDMSAFSALGNITAVIGKDVLTKICSKITPLQQCVDENFKTSMKPLDMSLRVFLNLDNLGTTLTRLCALNTVLQNNLPCLTDSSLALAMCGGLVFEGSTVTVPDLPGSTGLPMTDEQFNFYCPAVGDMFRCAAIQLSVCSPALGEVLRSVPTELLTTNCGRLAGEGLQTPLTSTYITCGLRHVSMGLELFMSMGSNTSPSSSEITTLIGNAINFVCEILPDYFKCLASELPSSKNRLDKFIGTLVDTTQFQFGDAITKLSCDPARIKAVEEMIPCIMTKESELGVCGTQVPAQSIFDNFNMSVIGLDPKTDIQMSCGPLLNLTMCVVDKILIPCNKGDVAQFAKDMFLGLMATDCYGTRDGPLTSAIDKARREAAGSSALTASVLTLLLTLAITIIRLY